ncbi:hypothetical protein ACS0PU_002798 [Formica fusca]
MNAKRSATMGYTVRNRRSRLMSDVKRSDRPADLRIVSLTSTTEKGFSELSVCQIQRTIFTKISNNNRRQRGKQHRVDNRMRR